MPMQKHHSQPRSDLRLFTPSLCNPSVFLLHVICSYQQAVFLSSIFELQQNQSGIPITCVDAEITPPAAMQLKELLQGPYRTLEAFRSEGKSTVSLISCKLRFLLGALAALDTTRGSHCTALTKQKPESQS